jgi:hypothetical protein
MPVVKNIPIPAIARQGASNELDSLDVSDALIVSVNDLGGDTDKARRRIQSRAGATTKRLGYRFSIRVIDSPLAGVDVELPAIGAWRIV